MKTKEEIEQRLQNLQQHYQDLLSERSQNLEGRDAHFFARPLSWINDDKRDTQYEITILRWILDDE